MPKEENKSSEQKSAEAEVEVFRKDLGPFVVAAETTRMAMVFTDAKQPGNPIVFANDSFLSLTGYLREEVLGQSFIFMVVQSSESKVLAQLEAAFVGSFGSDLEILYRRKDCGAFWAATFISPVRDETGDVVDAHGVHAGHLTLGSGAVRTSLLRFWAVAASRNSSPAPLKPRSLSLRSPRFRFRCANSISIFRRSRRESLSAA